MCIMLTMESTIMDMAMGVDATDLRNVLSLFGFSLDGGRRMGMSETKFCFVPVDWGVLIGYRSPEDYDRASSQICQIYPMVKPSQ